MATSKEDEEKANRAALLKKKSTNESTMENSVFQFEDVSFVVGSGDKRRPILEEISGQVKFGRKF